MKTHTTPTGSHSFDNIGTFCPTHRQPACICKDTKPMETHKINGIELLMPPEGFKRVIIKVN